MVFLVFKPAAAGKNQAARAAESHNCLAGFQIADLFFKRKNRPVRTTSTPTTGKNWDVSGPGCSFFSNLTGVGAGVCKAGAGTGVLAGLTVGAGVCSTAKRVGSAVATIAGVAVGTIVGAGVAAGVAVAN